MILDCIIVEDRKPDIDHLSRMIQANQLLNLRGTFKNAIDARNFINTHRIDLIFMDIKLPSGASGLDLFKTLEDPPQVIFITQYKDFALDGFDVEATDFLEKPVKPERLEKALQKVLEKNLLRGNETKDFIFIRDNRRDVKLYFRDILFVQGLGNFVLIKTIKGKYTPLESLNLIEKQLPTDQFIKIHRRYSVNLFKIDELLTNSITIAHMNLPVSKPYKQELKRRLDGLSH